MYLRLHRLLLNRDGLPSKALLALRLTLIQPSPCWRTIRLDDVRCFKRGAFAGHSAPVLIAERPTGGRIRRMVPAEPLPWHSNEDAKAVIGLLASTEQLRHSLQDVVPPQRPASMFTLSYEEVVIGVTSEKHPSARMDDYLQQPRKSARARPDGSNRPDGANDDPSD